MPDTFTSRAWTHPWQVVRINHNGTLGVITSHRTERAADLHAAARDWAAVLLASGGTPDHHYDVRRTPDRGRH